MNDSKEPSVCNMYVFVGARASKAKISGKIYRCGMDMGIDSKFGILSVHMYERARVHRHARTQIHAHEYEYEYTRAHTYAHAH